jgi:hypothetical protein
MANGKIFENFQYFALLVFKASFKLQNAGINVSAFPSFETLGSRLPQPTFKLKLMRCSSSSLMQCNAMHEA